MPAKGRFRDVGAIWISLSRDTVTGNTQLMCGIMF
jgi:hypothetical protein